MEISIKVNTDELLIIYKEKIKHLKTVRNISSSQVDEMNFIASSLCKFLAKEENKNKSLSEAISKFYEALDIIADGFFGTSISPQTIEIFKNIDIFSDSKINPKKIKISKSTQSSSCSYGCGGRTSPPANYGCGGYTNYDNYGRC